MFTSTSKINYEDKIPRLLGSFLLVMGIVISGCSKTPDESSKNNTDSSNQPVQSYQPKAAANTPAQPKMVGRINNFHGSASDYVLVRNGKKIKVGILVPVHEGDTIIIKHQYLMLELFLGGTYSIRVSYEDSPYVVNEMDKVPDKWTNTWQWVTTLFGIWKGDNKCDPNKMLCDPLTPVVRSQTRGDSILMPLLQDNPSQMVAGERSLYLRWFGGKPPYQVSISEDGQALTSESVEAQWLKTQPLSLAATKTYQVTIKDANGQTMTENFKVVATTIDFPEALQEDTSLSPESRQTIWAMELAAQKRGQWMLEAYQQASEIADKYYPAWLLRERLEKGLRVRKPK
jgi:hypothetical protein